MDPQPLADVGPLSPGDSGDADDVLGQGVDGTATIDAGADTYGEVDTETVGDVGTESDGAGDYWVECGLPVGLAELLTKRDNGERFVAGAEALDLVGISLSGLDLSGLDLSGADLSYAELVGCNLRGTRLVRTNLTGAQVVDADLAGAELMGAVLDGVDMSNANLNRAGLLEATAVEGIFFGARCEGASFKGADLTGAEFRAAELSEVSMADATLDQVSFATALLPGADLAGADLRAASFRDADLRGARLRYVKHYDQVDWIDADITDADFTGAWNVRRHIQDVNYIHEFRTQSRRHEVLYYLWWITSDCGRSLLRWSLWSALIAVIYAAVYTKAGIDWGGDEGPLSPIYFSVVTFTTLGFGDVLPTTSAGHALVMSEVVLGYLSLGGLMSILSDKMARRAG